MAKLFADENVPYRLVETLRKYGHDVQTVAQAGFANQGVLDADILTYASNERRAVISLNRRDFIRLHSRFSEHAGIIVCTQDPDLDSQAERIHALLQGANELTNQLIRVNRPRQ